MGEQGGGGVMKRALLFVACVACASPVESSPPNACEEERLVLVAPELAAWAPAIAWAFETWDAAAGGARARVVVSADASRSSRSCVTSFVAGELAGAVLAVTDAGFVVVEPRELSEEQRRAVALHELGHLVYGLGDSRDATSAMGLPIHLPARLSASDVAAAHRRQPR